MLNREELVLFENMAKDYFVVELFLFYLNQYVCLLHQWVWKTFNLSFLDWL